MRIFWDTNVLVDLLMVRSSLPVFEPDDFILMNHNSNDMLDKHTITLSHI